MIKVISINGVNINADDFSDLYKRRYNIELEIMALQEDAKSITAEAKDKHKLKPSLFNKFVKARIKATTKDVVKDGELFAVMDGVLDD